MDDKNEPQTEGVGVRGYELRGTLDGLRAKENRLKVFGERDVEATRVFRNYHLPGQDSLRALEGEGEVAVARALVDPEEYVIRLDTEEQSGRFQEMVKAEQRTTAEKWELYKMPGQPYAYSSLEIIVGDLKYPESCCRYNLQDVQTTEIAGQLVLFIAPNIEYEKGKDVGVPSALFHQVEMQNFPPHMALGGRTGEQISHQRSPAEVTRYFEEPAKMEITIGKDNLWIVAVDAEEVAKKTEVKSGQ